MPQTVELRPGRQPALDAENVERRQRVFAQVQLLDPRVPNDRLPATGLLGAATYKGGTLSDPVDLQGVAGTRVVGDVTFLGRTSVRGVQFDREVNVGAQGDAVFVGCRFLRPVRVAAGGKVAATGCRFDEISAILNAGVAADCGVLGAKTSAVAHTNTTVVFET